MKRNRVLTVLLCLLFSVVLCIGFTACGGSDKDQTAETEQVQEEELQDDEVDIDEELEEKEEAMIEAEENAEDTPILRDKKYEDFVGTWKTETSLADETFGGYTITFHEDMTFEAVVTGEEETGKCVYEDGIVTAQNEVLNDQFWFNEDEIMVVNENEAMAMLKKVK